MKKTLLILQLVFMLITINVNAQDTIVFKNNWKQDTVLCKIKNATSTNIFYIEKGEHKSDYMKNVLYYSKGKNDFVTKSETKQTVTKSNVSVQELIVVKQSVWQILSIIKIRTKIPSVPNGYVLSMVYSLPQSGLIPLLANEPTFYVYKKK